MLLATISLAHHSARQRELLKSRHMGLYVYQYARELIERTPGLAFHALATRGIHPFMKELPGSILRVLSPADPADFQPGQGQDTGWHVVLRPLMGRISFRRLAGFCGQIEQMDENAPPGTVDSAVPFSAADHPVWQTRAMGQSHLHGSCIRMRAGSKNVMQMGRDIYTGLGDQSRAVPGGSQHISRLLHVDGALQAFALGQEARPGRKILFTDPEDYRADLPLFFRLPLFEMDEDTPLHVDGLAAIARRELRKNRNGRAWSC